MDPLSGNNDIHADDERIEDLEPSGPATTITLDDPVFMRPSASPVPNVFRPERVPPERVPHQRPDPTSV